MLQFNRIFLRGSTYITKNLKDRIDYIDISKGLGMLMVVWGHIMLSGFSFKLVYAIDIPLFFFLAGMMFKSNKYTSLISLIKSRAKTLLLPYVIFSFATWVVWVAYNFVLGGEVESYINPLLQTFIAQGSGGYLVHNVPLWFVTCLFLIEIVYYFICKLKPIFNILICSSCAIISYFMLNNSLSFNFTKLPWNIECALSALIFYCLGNLFASRFGLSSITQFCKNKKAVAWVSVAVLTVILVTVAPLNGAISIGSNHIGNYPFLFYPIGFLGLFSTIIFAELISKFSFPIAKNIIAYLRWIGKNSFYFMATHVPIKGFIIVVLAKLINTTTDKISTTMGYSMIAFIISMIVTSITVLVIIKALEFIKKLSKK